MKPKKSITKQEVLNKTIENKKIVRSYARGEISSEEGYEGSNSLQ